MTGLIVGSDAHMMPVSTSIIDQIAASVLSPRQFSVQRNQYSRDLYDSQVISSDLETTYSACSRNMLTRTTL
jgi:hypothetical protein